MKLNFNIIGFELRRNPRRLIITLNPKPNWYRKDLKSFKRLSKRDDFLINDSYPCIADKADSAGNIHSTYFIQDLYIAQKIFKLAPVKHVDVGSRIDGFIAHVASFRKIEVLDIREMKESIDNVEFKQIDFMDSAKVPTNYCDSISSLHAIEHFGLGRYGDKIDPDGHKKGLSNITRMLQQGGHFYFSVPMGVQRIDFNAHRVFCFPYLLDLVLNDYDISSFSYIDDTGYLHRNVQTSGRGAECSFGCENGCAIFDLIKK